MNKISMNKSKVIINENKTYFMEFESDVDLIIDVTSNINAKLVINGKNCNYDIVLNLKDNSSLIVNSLNNNVSTNVRINLYNSSNIEYNHSLISSIDSINSFVVNHLNKNTHSIIRNNGINLDNNKLFFIVDGIIKKECFDSSTSQYNKIINFKNGNSKIIPNLIVDNNEIVANHSAYIGNFKEDDIFYIKSRGISEELMYRLLYRSLLLGNMDLKEEKEMFNRLLKEWGLL